MGYVTVQEWERHYADGRGFRPLGETERALLAAHTPAPDGGTALDVGCGTGELADYLSRLGYRVDAVDYADSALARARERYRDNGQVRWLRLDVERADFTELRDDGYDLIALRLAYPFLHDRARTLRRLGERLRPGGGLVVISPSAEQVPDSRRGIALDEEEIGLLTEGWEKAERFDADGLTMLVLRGAPRAFAPVEKGRPVPHAVAGACAVVTDAAGRVLLGRSVSGMWELPGGSVEPGESFETTAVRELAEETGLRAAAGEARLHAVLLDENESVPRVSAVVRVPAWSGTLRCPEPHRFHRWEWHEPRSLATLGPVFAPSAQALEAVWPGVLPGPGPLSVCTAPAHDGARDSTYRERGVPTTGNSGAENGVWRTVHGLARAFEAHADARGVPRQQQWTVQVLKLAEETGEAAQALIGVQGANPRKGHSHRWEDVHAEVADVVITGLVSLARMRPDDAADYLRRQLTVKAGRIVRPAASPVGAERPDAPGAPSAGTPRNPPDCRP
ncbi:NUDIX domain-containing protein [Streptomyces sp. NPDC053499]|uniref:NUDIX domain-containing protein n=1 Tax=Streptomyces sp. NPDC053499 TaxID=3365707 RepID=UPI0037D813FD